MQLSLLLVILAAVTLSTYASRNVTVDDTNGDEVTGGQIVYQPAAVWQVGQNCTNCTANLDDRTQAYDSTWHDASYFPSDSNVATAGQFPTASYTFDGMYIFSCHQMHS